MRRICHVIECWVYINRVPWSFSRLYDGAMSMLGFIVAIGLGVGALRELGVLHSLGWHYLIFLPVIGMVVALRRMRECHNAERVPVTVSCTCRRNISESQP